MNVTKCSHDANIDDWAVFGECYKSTALWELLKWNYETFDTHIKDSFSSLLGATYPRQEYLNSWASFMSKDQRSESEKKLGIWREQLNFFNSIKMRLLTDESYRGKYVAIWNKQLVDLDSDEFSLANRIDQRYPGEVVLIVKVTSRHPTAKLPSPRIRR